MPHGSLTGRLGHLAQLSAVLSKWCVSSLHVFVHCPSHDMLSKATHTLCNSFSSLSPSCHATRHSGPCYCHTMPTVDRQVLHVPEASIFHGRLQVQGKVLIQVGLCCLHQGCQRQWHLPVYVTPACAHAWSASGDSRLNSGRACSEYATWYLLLHSSL